MNIQPSKAAWFGFCAAEWRSREVVRMMKLFFGKQDLELRARCPLLQLQVNDAHTNASRRRSKNIEKHRQPIVGRATNCGTVSLRPHSPIEVARRLLTPQNVWSFQCKSFNKGGAINLLRLDKGCFLLNLPPSYSS